MKKKYILEFSPKSTSEPITYNLIKNYDIIINILKAEIGSGKQGKLLIEMGAEQEKLNEAVSYLLMKGIKCLEIDKSVIFKQSECVSCGACTSVCFSEALTLDKKTAKINFDSSKCVVCGLCTKACPLQLFTVNFVK